nr:MAG TPA: hypothetical protein [Microviridae sp.]
MMVCRINLNLFVMEERDILNVLSNSEFVTVRPIDEMRFVTEQNGSVRFVSDATLLLNEQRIINDIGEDNYRNFIRELQVNPSSPYKDGNFTDEQLMTEIKSRYVQSPSEVREWVRDMLDKQEQISDEAKAKLEEMKASESESTEPSDSVVESDKSE